MAGESINDDVSGERAHGVHGVQASSHASASVQTSGGDSSLTTLGGLVRFDMPCISCGYNLRSLDMRGICPECATQVAKSLDGFTMQTAPREYVALLHKGLVWTMWGIIATMLLMLGSFVLGAMLAARGLPAGGTRTVMSFGNIAGVGVTIATACISLGIWWLTAQERSDRPFAPLHTPRLLARGGAIVIALLGVWTLVSQLFMQQGMVQLQTVMQNFKGQATQAQRGGAPPVDAILAILNNLPYRSVASLVISSVLLNIAWCIAVMACMAYCRWVSRRLRDAKLVKLCTIVFWGTPVVFVLFGCTGFAPVLLQIAMAFACWRMARAIAPLVRVHG